MILWFKNSDDTITAQIWCDETYYVNNGLWQGTFVKKDNDIYFGYKDTVFLKRYE